MFRRILVSGALAGLALTLAATAMAADVTVRVEGKSRNIFGGLPAKIEADNPLQALEAASTRGEFHFVVTSTSFGDYVSQIGKYAGAGSSGWVFKVNGKSPPVGADQLTLKNGDEVLWYWATFGDTGGPPTLALKPSGTNCYVVTTLDDVGKSAPASAARLHVDGRRFKVDDKGQGCVGKHRGKVRAYAVGAVRSNLVK